MGGRGGGSQRGGREHASLREEMGRRHVWRFRISRVCVCAGGGLAPPVTGRPIGQAWGWQARRERARVALRGAVVSAEKQALQPNGDGDVWRRTQVATDERHAREIQVYAKAEALGLCGPLGKRKPDLWEGSVDREGRGEGAALVDTLREGVRARVMRHADMGRLGTAIEWFGDFKRDTTRVPFVPLDHAGDLSAGAYNAETMELMGEYMRVRGSRKAGKAGAPLQSDHIQACVSTIRMLRSAEAHYGVVVPEADTNLSTLYKEIRKDNGPKGERKESRGFRSLHFRVLLQQGYPHEGGQAAVEWAIALMAHNLMLRGGEVGRTDSQSFDPARDLTITSVVEMAPCAESGWMPWIVVWVVSIKDPQVKFRAVPLPIRARGGSEVGMCAYRAAVGQLQRRRREVPECTHACKWCKPSPGAARLGGRPPATCRRANAPLFLTESGEEYTTQRVRELGGRMAEAAGMPEGSVGGKLWRIGGATDAREVMGDDSQRIIKQRGRWGSDVSGVYQRALTRDMLDASVAVANAASRDMEEMVRGWTQPATFR